MEKYYNLYQYNNTTLKKQKIMKYQNQKSGITKIYLFNCYKILFPNN